MIRRKIGIYLWLILTVGVLQVKNAVIYGQCTQTISSTNGYQVNVTLDLVGVIAPSSCPYGYNYNVQMDYNISYSGNASPAMYTMQARIHCWDDNIFVDLPNSKSSGIVTTTTNPYNNTNDCATATLQSLQCSEIVLEIQGPGIPYQNLYYNCISGPQPIGLLEFKVEKVLNNHVLIEWITLTETDNDHFTVEKSQDALHWEELAVLDGVGNSSVKHSYNTIDYEPYLGVSYYRLKQTDYDGHSSYSDIESIELNELPDLLIRYKTDGGIAVEGAVNLSTVKIYNVAGQEITQKVGMSTIHNGLELDLQQAPQGIYFLSTPYKSYKIYNNL